MDTMKKIRRNIFIGTGYEKLSDFFSCIKKQMKVCVIADEIVAKYQIETLKKYLHRSGIYANILLLKGKEEEKTLATIEKIYHYLFQKQYTRGDMLLAFGGGVIGDIVGYAAATYMRGIPYLQVPTTLLAMVDSSIGGKTAVNFYDHKNMIGAFYPPEAIYMNLDVLKTLPERQYDAAFGEIIKYAFIKDKKYVSWLEQSADRLKKRDLLFLQEMVCRCCRMKLKIVCKDPKERGDRVLLNFGHTIGHALEQQSGFSLLHGECVAIGMVAAAHISYQKRRLSYAELMQIEHILKKFHLPVRIKKMNQKELLSVIQHDKKRTTQKFQFIILQKIGKACVDLCVTEEQLQRAMDYIMQ